MDALPPPLLPPPRRAPGSPAAFFAALLVAYVGLGFTAQALWPVAGLAWTQLFVFLLPAFASAAASNLVPSRALLLDRAPPRGTVAVAALAGTVGFLAAGAGMALVSALLPRELVKAFDLAPLFRGPPAERLALAATASLLAPLCEEVAFRGHLLTLLGARLRPGAAIATTALLFAVLHLDPVRFVAVLGLGLVFGWLTWRAGSIWPAVAAHAANNAAGVAIFSLAGAEAAGSAERPQPLASLAALAAAVALLAPLLALYRRLTPAPPPFEAALLPADDADDAPGLRLRRVPPRILRLAWLGLGLLALIAAAARWR